MNKYIRMIDKQLKVNDKIELAFDIKELTEDRLEYIHALDMFMRNKVTQRYKSNKSIYARVDAKSVNIRFRNGKLGVYACSCNNNMCKHILATLIAFEKEPNTFTDKHDRMSKIMYAHKKLMESMEYSSREEDIELLNTLPILISINKDNMSQHIIGLLIISILTKLDNKYGADTIRIVNEKVAENLNLIKDAISVKREGKSIRSWDNMISELINRVG